MLAHESTLQAPQLRPSDRIAEANHRIANNLAAIAGLIQRDLTRLGGGAVTPEDARNALAEVRARIDAVARLHRALSHAPDGDQSIDAGLYVQQVARELVSSLTRGSSVTLHFAGEIGCPIASSRALYLGQILIELLTNAVKYAHPTGVDGEIVVACRRGPNGLEVEVADDGIGLPEEFDTTDRGHGGLTLIRSLARHIGAELSLHNDALGLRCIVRLPY